MRQLSFVILLSLAGCASQEPVRIRLRPHSETLGSWSKARLEWYSGRGIYSANVTLDPAHVRDDVRLHLDLGKVCYCAEIWLKGKLVGTRIWPPYSIDITEHAKPGRNRLDIVVANLLANRMRWDIFDDVKGELWNRKWHDGNIRRDAWCLESGLIGPVRILPVRRVSVSAAAP